MLPNYIMWIIKYFDCIGFFTECKSSIFWRRLRYAISLPLLIHFTIARNDILQYISDLTVIETINGSLQCFGALFIYYLVFLESFFTRHLQREFWQKVATSDCCSLGEWKSWESFVYKFWSHLMLLIVYGVMMVLRVNLNVVFIIGTIVAIKRISQLRIFYYLLNLEIIRNNLKAIQLYAGEALKRRLQDDLLRGNLKAIRRAYLNTHDLVNCNNGIFGFSQFILVSYCFFLLLTDCNWFYIYIHKCAWLGKTCKLTVHLEFWTFI